MLRTLLCSGLGGLLNYPPTPPTPLLLSFFILLQHISTRTHTQTHTHIPLSCGYKGAHGHNGVKRAVNLS